MLSNEWRKSSRSNPSGNCVEARSGGTGVLVRDTKQEGRGPVLSFEPAAWKDFLTFVSSNKLSR